MLIEPYSADKKFRNFVGLENEIQNYYDHLAMDLDDLEIISDITPRYLMEHGLRIGFRDIFYYIDRLYDNHPMSVIDVGCGECIWKKWFPHIVGFDPTPSIYADCDFIDFFDEDFSKNHQAWWDCGMALNSVHFAGWTKIRDQIKMSMDIIKSGGRFLFTMNFDMIDKNSDENATIRDACLQEKIVHFDSIIGSLGYETIVKDYPTLRGISEATINRYSHLNGHARFILEK